MSDTPGRRHALADFLDSRAEVRGGDDAGVVVSVSPALDLIGLRGRAADDPWRERVEAQLGQALPRVPNTFSHDAHTVYWLGPDEWLIVAAPNADLASRLCAHLDGLHAAVNALNGGLVALQIAGPQTRALLAQGCTLNLDSDKFLPGQCAQTALAKASVLIALHDERPAFDIIVRRSFADYVARWLAHAGAPLAIHFAAADKGGNISPA